MNDLGQTYNKGMDAMPMKMDEPHYPCMTFDIEQIPELSGKKVGDKITICFEAEVIKCRTVVEPDEKEEEYTIQFNKGMVETNEKVKPSDKVLSKMKDLLDGE